MLYGAGYGLRLDLVAVGAEASEMVHQPLDPGKNMHSTPFSCACTARPSIPALPLRVMQGGTAHKLLQRV